MSGYPPDDTGQEATPGSMPPVGTPGLVRPEPPAPVRRASLVLYVIGGSFLLNFALGPFFRGEQPREGDGPSSDAVEVSLGVGLAIILLLVAVGVVAVVFYFVCARKMLEGRNWARITATILTSLGFLSGAGVVATGRVDTFLGVMLGIDVLLSAVFLVLAWQRQSNEFFNAARAR